MSKCNGVANAGNTLTLTWTPGRPVVEALVAHIAAEAAPVGDDARHCNPQVVVHLERLALVRAQLGRRAVQRCQHDMRVALRIFQKSVYQDAMTSFQMAVPWPVERSERARA